MDGKVVPIGTLVAIVAGTLVLWLSDRHISDRETSTSPVATRGAQEHVILVGAGTDIVPIVGRVGAPWNTDVLYDSSHSMTGR